MKWLDGYSGETTEQLILLEGEYRTDSIILAFEEGLQRKARRVGKTGLTDEEIAVLAVEALEREINNGGFSAFFVNSSKEYAPVILDALNRIGCPEVVRLARRAFELLGIKDPVTRADIDRVTASDEFGEHDEEFNQLDEQYYGLSVDLSAPLLDFIKSNRPRIVL